MLLALAQQYASITLVIQLKNSNVLLPTNFSRKLRNNESAIDPHTLNIHHVTKQQLVVHG